MRSVANYKRDNWHEHLLDTEVALNSAVNNATTYSALFLTIEFTQE